jgi:hypothetical protein
MVTFQKFSYLPIRTSSSCEEECSYLRATYVTLSTAG